MSKTAGIFAASFNPFHLGHLNIALKAKKIFDRVYIVQARNTDKPGEQKSLPKSLINSGFYINQLEVGDLTTDFVTRIENNRGALYSEGSEFDSVTLIRGLRNIVDFTYEENLCAVYRKLKPDINIIHIMGDPEFNYISSSLLRNYGELEEFKKLIL